MKVLLLEPYCGGSHRAWAEGYVQHSRHDVTLLGLAARFWKWRMQGAVVTLAEQARALDYDPDVILSSDMLNLPAFLALTRDFLSGVPCALYCHENQLTYPVQPGEKRDLSYGMINWLSMLAADQVFFNSRYHLEDWFEALPDLLKHFPDASHLHRVADVRNKAAVLPVGCDLRRLDAVPPLASAPGGSSQPLTPPLVLWNQRWEYDKAPETFFQALLAMEACEVNFRVALAGRCHRRTAPGFEEAREWLRDRIVHFGYAVGADYYALLRRADVVVSTAIHEFFGVAIVEAIYAGCFPVLPNCLSYPELIPRSHHDVCLYDSFEGLLARLRWALTHPDNARSLAKELRPALARFDWNEMAPLYDGLLGGMA